MPDFHYKAAKNDGSIVEGIIEGENPEVVAAKLRVQEIFPISISRDKRNAWSLSTFLNRSEKATLTRKECLLFTQSLATLLDAGLTLEQSFANLLNTQQSPKEHSLIKRLSEDITAGKTLSSALSNTPETFSPFYLAMVKSGEASGDLSEAFTRLADHLEKSQTLRDSFISATIYPVILFTLSILSMIFLLGLIIPRFVNMFEGSEEALPVLTQIVFWCSGVFVAYGWIGLLLLIILSIGVQSLLKVPSYKKALNQRIIALPILGSLFQSQHCSLFAQSMSTLLINGLSLTDALELTKEGSPSQQHKSALTSIIEQVKSGRPLASSLQEEKLIPPLAVDLIRLGEDTGNLGKLFHKVAELYEKDTSKQLKRLLVFLEPVLILGLGLLISLIILSVLLAMLSLNSSII